jgi:transporter family-2 protein
LWTVVAVTAVGGIAAALQAQFAGAMANKMGTLESVFATYGLGAVVVSVLVAFARGGNLALWRELPPYVFLAGTLGLVIVGSLAYGTARVGVVEAIMTYTVAQFLFGALIDQFGWFGADVRAVDLPRLGGLVLMLAGTWLVLR